MRPLSTPRLLLLMGPALLTLAACDPWQLAPDFNGDPSRSPTPELLRGAGSSDGTKLNVAPAPAPPPFPLYQGELKLQSACEGLPPEDAEVCRRRLGERQGPTSPSSQGLSSSQPAPIPEPIPVPAEP